MRRSWIMVSIAVAVLAVAAIGVVGSGAWFTSLARGEGNRARTDTLAVQVAGADGSSPFVPLSVSLLPGDPPVATVFSVNKTGSIPPKYWVVFRVPNGGQSSPQLAAQVLVDVERDANNGVGAPSWTPVMDDVPLAALLDSLAPPRDPPLRFSGGEARHVLRVSLYLPEWADNSAQGLTQDFFVKIVATQPSEAAPFPAGE